MRVGDSTTMDESTKGCAVIADSEDEDCTSWTSPEKPDDVTAPTCAEMTGEDSRRWKLFVDDVTSSTVAVRIRPDDVEVLNVEPKLSLVSRPVSTVDVSLKPP